MTQTRSHITRLAGFLALATLLAACGAPAPPPATAPPSAPEAPVPGTAAEPVPGAGPAAQPPLQPPDGPDEATEPAEPGTAPTPPLPAVVAEAWLSESRPSENLDAVAVWRGRGHRPWLLATAAATDRLLVVDAESGETLREVGSSGDAAGRFRRPSGIAVLGDLAFVVERDNARVQVLRLPGLSTAGFVGLGSLVRPSGVTVSHRDGFVHLYVSDDYAAAAPGGEPDLTRRVHHYRVAKASFTGAAAELDGELVRTFGDADGPGALHQVETLIADPGRGRLLVAEGRGERAGLRVYGLDGRFRDRVVGGFAHGPEGLALYACADGGGYWIATDRIATAPGEERTLFRILDRADLGEVGRFTGERTAGTDGVWLTPTPTAAFPAGALYAVHDDRGVAAFDWRAVAAALGLRDDCGVQAAAP